MSAQVTLPPQISPYKGVFVLETDDGVFESAIYASEEGTYLADVRGEAQILTLQDITNAKDYGLAYTIVESQANNFTITIPRYLKLESVMIYSASAGNPSVSIGTIPLADDVLATTPLIDGTISDNTIARTFNVNQDTVLYVTRTGGLPPEIISYRFRIW